ncbi:MAG: UDP-D-galactose:(glucosyl)lipopolysaccharide-1,6-D-galactosyltransferase [candidate division WS2 bacterium ADurb.Bin280]|uniref:UDP-D-galactose:(Glucosyl)lipopolysaccharide-1, 6-D-galactosyltransferase n=1 Tax=candidate division WS2 bacterium ADurb.Bin280 TaxID=1852829 RepID=A0A1V5SEE2_9BACT|nr:MAG: UDP-D-galactose:(glucosyl)lipopolysaccharide-1,6-D-galactosyltransferase [candidate division WS2 bacterium ADurb.Bin280]
MKIAFIRYPDYLYKSEKVIKGGSEVANQQIIDALRSSGVEVVEFAPESQERFELASVPAIGTPLMFQDLYKKIDEINSCDLVVTTNWFGMIIPEIKVPLVVIFHSNSKSLARSIDIKNITDKENLKKWLDRAKEFGLGLESKQGIHEQIIAIEEEYYCKNADHVVAVSEALRESLIEDYQIAKERITAINNPYDADWEGVEIKKDFSSKLEVVALTRLPGDLNGFVWKSADRIAEVFSNLKNVKTTIVAGVGKANYRDFFIKFVPDAQLVENADHGQVASILSKANIALLMSRWEACQMTLIESMTMGVIPISFRVGVAEEAIEDGVNGFLVESIDEALSVVDMLDKDRELAAKISANARKSAKEKFNTNYIGEEYKSLFEEIINKSRF